jgi:CRP-like cAMP-binding protein
MARPKTKGDSGLFPAINRDAGFLAGIGEAQAIKAVDERAVIFAQGDAADEVFYIRNGKVKVAVVSNTGKEAVIAVIARRRLFRRRMSGGATIADGDRDRHDSVLDPAVGPNDCSRDAFHPSD